MKKLLFLIMSISTVLLSFSMSKDLARYEQEKHEQQYEDQLLQLLEEEKILQEYVDKRPYVNRDKLFEYFRETGYTLMEAIAKKDTSKMCAVIESIPSEIQETLVNGFIDGSKLYDDRNRAYQQYLHNFDLMFNVFNAYSPLSPITGALYLYFRSALRKDSGYWLTPLMIAVMTEDKKILEALVGCGVPIDMNKGFPLQIAVAYNAWAIPFLLQKGATGIDEALYYAVVTGYIDAANELLQAGASLNSRDSKSHLTPLQAACVNMNHNMVNLLLGNGALIDEIDPNGRTLLRCAVEHNDFSVANFLLEQGAFVDETDPNGLTPLHWAVEHEAYLIADFLLEHGANVLAKDKTGRTVIECMSSFDAKEGVWLLGCGAPYPTTAFHRDIMEDRGMETNKNLSFVLKNSSEFFKNYVRALIKGDTKGALAAIKKAGLEDINKAGPTNGLKPLHWAVVRNNREVIERLVIDRTTLKDFLPQYFANITAFYDRIIDINCRDDRGRTPLMWAARLGYADLYHILKRAGAKGAYVDKKGKMALNYAADYRNVDIIREMIIDGTLSARPVTNQN